MENQGLVEPKGNFNRLGKLKLSQKIARKMCLKVMPISLITGRKQGFPIFLENRLDFEIPPPCKYLQFLCSCLRIAGKGVIPPFSRIPPFLKIQNVPIFYRPIRKTKVLNDSFNQFVYKLCLNFGRIFTKVVKCKLDIMPLNVFRLIL